jgi:Fe-S-cluster containining protein
MAGKKKDKNENKRDKLVQSAFKQLEKFYATIPDTEGCMANISKPTSEGGCGGWCCMHQNPHVTQVEFLYTWKYVLKNWDFGQITALIEAAIRNYLSSRLTKGCIFFDRESKMCKIHEVRPFNCRIYGITPEEEIKPRIERLRILAKGQIDAVVKDQCPLVKTVDGTVVTEKHTADWWKKLVEIEKSIGIKASQINDKGSGTYMTYHDHLLLHVTPDTVLKQLQILKAHGENYEKETAIKGIMDGFRKKIEIQLAAKEAQKEQAAEDKPDVAE